MRYFSAKTVLERIEFEITPAKQRRTEIIASITVIPMISSSRAQYSAKPSAVDTADSTKPVVYLAVNVAINTAAQYTMTRIYPVNLILIVIGYALGWLLSMLILRAFPSIDWRFGL